MRLLKVLVSMEDRAHKVGLVRLALRDLQVGHKSLFGLLLAQSFL